MILIVDFYKEYKVAELGSDLQEYIEKYAEWTAEEFIYIGY